MAGTTRSHIIGGVDTHKDTHAVAALDSIGRMPGSESFPATTAGYVSLLKWLRSFGALERVGVEGTGAYGAGLTRYLATECVPVVEVNRLKPTDAEAQREVGPR